jgi:hypothetical protein
MPASLKRGMLGADLGAVSAAVVEIQPWELHSELVLVCPEVCRRALELLPERDPDAFLVGPPRAPAELRLPHGLPAAVFGYALGRLAETARIALVAIGGLAALASLVEAVHSLG